MDKILGSSPQAQTIQKIIKQAARANVPVLIHGERGTGRQFIASLIHRDSARSGSFETLACRGIAESVLAAELVRLFDMARDGTLFLDDIDELGPAAQEELLRRMPAANVRIVGASTADLEEAVQAGKFSAELCRQLAGIRIVVPPLRERKPDIPILAHEFLAHCALRLNKPLRNIHPVAMKKLTAYTWPGNVRELRDAVERAAAASTNGGVLHLDDFEFLVLPNDNQPLHALIPGASIYDIEKEAILRTLEHVGGSTSAAARILKMSVRKVQYKLKEYGAVSR